MRDHDPTSWFVAGTINLSPDFIHKTRVASVALGATEHDQTRESPATTGLVRSHDDLALVRGVGTFDCLPATQATTWSLQAGEAGDGKGCTTT
jgi:hypothetical protein